MGAEPVQQPLDVYTSNERLERERALLRRCPILLTSTARLREPGDFVTHDALGVPVLLWVDKTGTIRGFLNVCRHRGARLVEELEGAGRHAFACPYHGWTYASDGALRHIPHAHGFDADQCRRTQLSPFPIHVRHGFVWSSPGAEVDHFLGPLADELAGWGLENGYPAYQFSISAAANWKLLMEQSFETYHLRRIHAHSVYPWVYDNVALLDDFHPHQRMIVPKRGIEEYMQRDEASWNILSVANVVYLIFPNTILLVREAAVVQHSLFPDGLDQTRWLTSATCSSPPQTAQDRQALEQDKESFRITLGEDFIAASSVQQGLRCEANRAFTFGRFEAGLIRYHRAMEHLLAGLVPLDDQVESSR